MKKIMVLCLAFVLSMNVCVVVRGEEKPNLYAKAAILYEAKSGRVLYESHSQRKMSNASTTKILTCFYILKHGNLNDKVMISENAASQPKVSMGVRKGETYLVKDLLYAMMLESYNDCAVALAEYARGTVSKFESKINEMAKKMGARQTHFVTPNGLEGKDAHGSHKTTAYDLALIMRQCIKNPMFLKITHCKSYSFMSVGGKRAFTCANHNALLYQMDGAFSGKTGFTSKAGYCYVGAIHRKKMTFIVVLLGCGWPPHKSYKWQDVKSLVSYGENHYTYQKLGHEKMQLKEKIKIKGGYKDTAKLWTKSMWYVWPMKKSEHFYYKYAYPRKMKAPVHRNKRIGTVTYFIDGKKIKSQGIYVEENILEKTMWWYMGKIFGLFLKR